MNPFTSLLVVCCHESLLDRIDIQIEVLGVDYEKLSGDCVGESSEAIIARVQATLDIPRKRFSSNGSSYIVCNADMRVGVIWQIRRLFAGCRKKVRV